MTDIYNDQSYIANNPELHCEDSAFKFNQIAHLLEHLRVSRHTIKILDVGGGAGVLGAMVVDHFERRRIAVEFVALDLSAEMLVIQSQNNPSIVRTLNCSVADCPNEAFDLVLMIDVIEHVPDKDAAAERLNQIGANVIYNIPIQVNLFDLLRNAKNRGQYYAEQTRLLGHVHFFTYAMARRFIGRHHRRVKSFFKPYCGMMLESRHPRYMQLRESRIRLLEVRLSCWIAKRLRWLAPWIVQGSLFALVTTRSGSTRPC